MFVLIGTYTDTDTVRLLLRGGGNGCIRTLPAM